MSVVVIVKVSEGLVLGADSAATISGEIRSPQGQVTQGVLKTYFNARKLLQIGNFPIGVLTWGSAFIGPRTLESLIREWEYENDWRSMDNFRKNGGSDIKYEVEACAKKLQTHLLKAYEAEFETVELSQRPVLGVIVAGYSENGFFPEIWRFIFPDDASQESQVHNQRPDQNGKPDFGASWFGLTDSIVRLHFGRDEQIFKALSDKYSIKEEELREILDGFQYQIPFPVMPLQDAIDYANYLLTVAIGRYRFVLGSELVGGAIEIAAITQHEFEWISQKKRALE